MGSKGSAPSSPDPYKIAAYAQHANAIPSYSPYGSTTYTYDANGVPTSSRVSFSGPMQKQFQRTNKTRNQLLRTVKGVAATPFAMPDAARADEVAKTMYARKLGMVAPELDRRQSEMNTQLSDRGIPIGSEVYGNEQNRLAQEYGDTLAGISQDSVLAAGNEEDRLLRNALTLRAQPFNELAGFSGGTPIQVPTSSAGAYQVQPPDIAGLSQNDYNNQTAAYNAQQSNMWSGLFGLGKAALGFLG